MRNNYICNLGEVKFELFTNFTGQVLESINDDNGVMYVLHPKNFDGVNGHNLYRILIKLLKKNIDVLKNYTINIWVSSLQTVGEYNQWSELKEEWLINNTLLGSYFKLAKQCLLSPDCIFHCD